jgi:pimeloyl-ACP methyl ester carboxylesterase
VTRNIYRHGLVATVEGSGPPLFLLHGLASSRAVWQPIVPALSEHFTTVCVDLLGHGASDWIDPNPELFTPAEHAAALKPLIDEFGGTVHLAGNSMGGWIGFEIAANGWARSLTALCPAGLAFHPWSSRNVLLVNNYRLSRLLGPAMAPTTELIARIPRLREVIMGYATTDFETLDPSLLGDGAKAMRQAVGFYASHDGMLDRQFSRADHVPADVPVAVVWGAQDRLIRPEHQRRVAAPQLAEWIVFDQCAHVPMWDQPDRTVEIICQTAQVSTAI